MSIAPAPVQGDHGIAALRRLYPAAIALLLAFSFPLYELFRFSFQSDLFSHIILVPFVSGYFIWLRRTQLPAVSEPHLPVVLAAFAAGLASAAGYVLFRTGFVAAAPVDALALSTLSFLFFLAGICAWKLGRAWLRPLAFPLGFLVFMIPFPVCVESAIETILQHGSAFVAHGLFILSGTTLLADGLTFQLTTITLHVAPECSGIHSSLALFITSIATGRLILRTNTYRLILALAVFPLALVRNGFRVFVLGMLCVHVNPDMIHSYIHRRGGPIFFALSLIPFFILLVLLIRSERKKAGNPNPAKP